MQEGEAQLMMGRMLPLLQVKLHVHVQVPPETAHFSLKMTVLGELRCKFLDLNILCTYIYMQHMFLNEQDLTMFVNRISELVKSTLQQLASLHSPHAYV